MTSLQRITSRTKLEEMPVGGAQNLPVQALWRGRSLVCYVTLQLNNYERGKTMQNFSVEEVLPPVPPFRYYLQVAFLDPVCTGTDHFLVPTKGDLYPVQTGLNLVGSTEPHKFIEPFVVAKTKCVFSNSKHAA